MRIPVKTTPSATRGSRQRLTARRDNLSACISPVRRFVRFPTPVFRSRHPRRRARLIGIRFQELVGLTPPLSYSLPRGPTLFNSRQYIARGSVGQSRPIRLCALIGVAGGNSRVAAPNPPTRKCVEDNPG